MPSIFEELQQFLKEQEKILLAQLERVSQELLEKSHEYNSRVSERELLLDTVIAQIEEKRDQPVGEFLMVRLHHPLGAVTPGEAGSTHLAPPHPSASRGARLCHRSVPAVVQGPEGREGWDEVWGDPQPP